MNLNLSSTILPGQSIGGLPALPRKLFKWLPDNTLQMRIDWSSIESFLGCNRAAEYSLVAARKAPPRTALVFGAAMHAALEIWYKSQPITQENRGEALVLCRTAIELTFAEYPHTIIDDWRTSEYCFENFLKYVGHYAGERLTPFEHEGRKMVEFSFAVPIGNGSISPGSFTHYGYGTLTDDEDKERAIAGSGPGSPIPIAIEWTGIIDIIAHWSDALWLVDHKTTSILSNDFFDGFEIAMQPVGYVLAARAAGFQVAGFMVNVLACRKPTKTGIPFEPFRRMYHYEQWHLDEWHKDTLAIIEEFLANLHSGFFPRKTQWCIGKYGKCPYFDVCTLAPDHRNAMLQSGNFTTNTWKPVQ